MAGHTEGMNMAYKGFLILLVVTFGEVGIAWLNIFDIVSIPKIVLAITMIIFSLFKAYFIVKEFMHVGHEVKAFGYTIVLPFMLLIWAVIAFLAEGEWYLYCRENF